MSTSKCDDQVTLDHWYAIAPIAEIEGAGIQQTTLLEQPIAYARNSARDVVVWTHEGVPGDVPDRNCLPVRERYGYVWTTLGAPEHDVFPIPEYAEADRRNIHAATFGVNVSAPRVIENFLDMGHFPFVHTDILGAEPHTEVKEYFVEVSEDPDEIVASNCKFWQPMAAAASTGGADVDYIYRVPHPYCSVLYKSSPLDESRKDVIAIFVQPLSQEQVRAHMLLSLLDDTNNDTDIRLFQQTIFGQDKPILENQYPKRLPLDPRAETQIGRAHV